MDRFEQDGHMGLELRRFLGRHGAGHRRRVGVQVRHISRTRHLLDLLRFLVHGTVHGPADPGGQSERLQRHGREQEGGGYAREKVHADTRDSGRQRALPANHDAEQGFGEQRHNVPAADVHGRGARPRERLPPSLPHHGPILGQLSGILPLIRSDDRSSDEKWWMRPL